MSDFKYRSLELRKFCGAEWPDKRISISDSCSMGAPAISSRYAELEDDEYLSALNVMACSYELLLALERVCEWAGPIAGDNADSEAALEEEGSIAQALEAIAKAKGGR